jgi:hypothetical protein
MQLYLRARYFRNTRKNRGILRQQQSEGRERVHFLEVGQRLEFKTQWQLSVESDPKGQVDKNLHVSQLTCFMLPLPTQCSKFLDTDISLTLYKTITETNEKYSATRTYLYCTIRYNLFVQIACEIGVSAWTWLGMPAHRDGSQQVAEEERHYWTSRLFIYEYFTAGVVCFFMLVWNFPTLTF